MFASEVKQSGYRPSRPTTIVAKIPPSGMSHAAIRALIRPLRRPVRLTVPSGKRIIMVAPPAAELLFLCSTIQRSRRTVSVRKVKPGMNASSGAATTPPNRSVKGGHLRRRVQTQGTRRICIRVPSRMVSRTAGLSATLPT